jgi:nitrate reductase molybdenum cofactor assembly chaperone
VTARARQRTVVLQAASVLLQYPDERVRSTLPVVRAAVDELADGTPQRQLLGFLDTAEAMPPLELQEHYVRVLDRSRRACLYLTWWTEGETRRRGLALARLKDTYRRHGFELVAAELPDFLPVLLEFAAGTEDDAGLRLLQEHRPGLELLRLSLTERRSPYSGPVEAVCALLPGPSPRDEAAARALARTGPPGERVGLEPYAADPMSATTADLGPTSLEPTGVRR